MATDERKEALAKWAAGLKEFSLKPETIRSASSDASFRRYFRIDSDGPSYIIMDAPPDKENTGPFMSVASLFKDCDVNVPKVLAADKENGFLLLSDLGNKTYLSVLNEENAQKLYLDAIDALIDIQVESVPDVLPEYSREELLRELNLFPEWYIARHLGKTLTEKQEADLKKVFDVILANNLAQPQVYVHRDYHSRNLMLSDGKANPGILDFQDALYGPITYDLVSLLRDAYIEWDEERVLDWVIRYWERARKAGLPVNPDIDAFYRDFEFMGVQRHLKVLGIFARLYHRDGKDGYLADLPLVLKYTVKAANRYRELAPLAKLLEDLSGGPADAVYSF